MEDGIVGKFEPEFGSEPKAGFNVGDRSGEGFRAIVQVKAGGTRLSRGVAMDVALFEAELPVSHTVLAEGERLLEAGMETEEIGGLIALGGEVSKWIIALEIA